MMMIKIITPKDDLNSNNTDIYQATQLKQPTR